MPDERLFVLGYRAATGTIRLLTALLGHRNSFHKAERMNGTMTLSKNARIVSWIAQIIAAVILAQTLFFKFTGAPESVYIFSTLGLEPWGRLGSGAAELVAVILLLYPKTPALGAALALGVIVGAIGAHLTKLGIEVQGDGGTLFFLAIAVFVTSLAVLVIRRRELPVVGRML